MFSCSSFYWFFLHWLNYLIALFSLLVTLLFGCFSLFVGYFDCFIWLLLLLCGCYYLHWFFYLVDHFPIGFSLWLFFLFGYFSLCWLVIFYGCLFISSGFSIFLVLTDYWFQSISLIFCAIWFDLVRFHYLLYFSFWTLLLSMLEY